MVSTEKDIIFIGAGFACLSAANKLKDLGLKNFLVLEKGHPLKKRFCPGSCNYSCSFCKVCHTVEGVGGANALNGNKFCYFPASQKIVERFDLNRIESVNVYLQNKLYPYFEKTLNFIDNRHKKEQDYFKKKYFSDAFYKGEFQMIVSMLLNPISDFLVSECEVLSIRKEKSIFFLETSTGKTYKAKSVVLGTGRSSSNFMKNLFDSFNLSYQEQKQDIGIRIESDADSFTNEYFYQSDPKIKLNFPNLGQGRTFCAHNNGIVVPVRFNNSFFADGAFSNTPTSRNNIAIMVRSNDRLPNIALEHWCKSINDLARNSLCLGDLILNSDFIHNLRTMIPSFPSAVHARLFELTIEHLLMGKTPLLKRGSVVRIFAPAIDRQWLQPEVNLDFSLNKDNNIYVIGDAVGRSRGFIQALFSGVLCANGLFEKEFSQKTKKICLSSV
ncbi:hypothetical protein HR09_04410 [Porphyromonas gulae]|uniref:hypothetical protein n=1 Tax=Porphyromonas gulae TaxID=111105 RepID=UPI00051D773D|nr:hypothetical protein [Porphyromonas gulae]KGL47673.1 hypothetical protein HQ49_07705 [Porphyromonas gulae]KGN69391.1 hypothetical protein HR09_04410 [Porphyromonas gulae]